MTQGVSAEERISVAERTIAPEDGHGRALRVLVADDDPLARIVLRQAVEAGGIVVVGEAASPSEAIVVAERRRPDVILMDAALKGVGGSAATRAIGSRVPAARVLMLANSIDTDTALDSLRSGASGYLRKDLDLSVLPNVIRRVAHGEAAISRTLTTALIDRLRALPDSEVGTRPVKSPLTPREWEVLDLLCLERSTANIARELFVTSETVRSHIKNILRKLQVSSRAEAVKEAHVLRHASNYDEAATGNVA
jgi:two-component system, NarL family, response regulator LiaR